MVAFRMITSNAVAEQVAETIKLLEARCWQNCLLLNIDPRTFTLAYTVPPKANEDDEQEGENQLADFQQKVINAYSLAGIEGYNYGDHLDKSTKIHQTERAVVALETLLVQRCAEHGLNPNDLGADWDGGELNLLDVKVYNDALHLAYSVLDSLNA